ncbi:unnamed protein product [Orchesella dallaii]|uniref:Odorant receptor n=1 Tax=Orchesella dallaii TaxID=48710 RepID=A0ABP1S7I1_9HEXA
MISETFLRVLKWRMSLMKYSAFTFISWDNKTNRMAQKKSIFSICNCCYLITYLYCVSLVATYFATGFISTESESGIEDIFDEDYQPRDEELATLCGLAHLMYACASVGLVGNLYVLLLTKRKTFVDFVTVSIDNSFQNQEKYKELLEGNPEAKRIQTLCECIIFLVAAATVVTPFIYGTVIFHEFCPEHQILIRLFEIKVKPEWKFVPLWLYVNYMVLQCCDLVFILDIGGILYLNNCITWFRLLRPVALKTSRESPKFLCNLGCTLDKNEVIMTYKKQQLLHSRYNSIFANNLITGHHATFLYISAIGLYICIRNWGNIYKPEYFMAILGPFFCILAERIEVNFVEDVIAKSSDYLYALDSLMKTENWRLKGLRKHWESLHVLEPKLAYPYYNLTYENFLLFLNEIVDKVVFLLVCLE